MLRIISMNVCSICSKNAKRKGIVDKAFNMVRGKEILLERQDGYQKLEDISY